MHSFALELADHIEADPERVRGNCGGGHEVLQVQAARLELSIRDAPLGIEVAGPDRGTRSGGETQLGSCEARLVL